LFLLYNATFYTLNPAQPTVQALAIADGKIVAAGTIEEVEAALPRNARRIDLSGLTVLPGLTDSHIHLQHYALGLQYVDCETSTRAECLERVQHKTRHTPAQTWIRGHGWNQNVWPEGFGNASLLDEVAPYHPVYLTAKSLHASWANSLALQAAGIDEHTPDPPDGRIQRDQNGKPTGILFESAMQLVEKVIPKATLPDVRQAIEAAQPHLWSMGLTGVHDFDQRLCFMALQELEQAGSLKLRVVKSIPLENLDEAVEVGLRSGFGSPRLRIGSVKCFADGALGPQTAAMLQPYEGSPSDTGLLFLDAEEIVEIGQRAAASGLSLAIHAIGDRANHEVLKAYAQLRQVEEQEKRPHLRHRIEHVQVLHPDHLPLLARHGIIASMQPIHATSDMDIADRYWGKRARYAYAFQSLAALGTRLTFGSDAPVESPNPFWGIHAAVTRQRHSGYPSPEGWYPQERLSLEQAIQAYTVNPAYTAGRENELGKLQPGYFADLIVLEEDPFFTPAERLFELQPLKTMVAGEWVWEK